MLYYILVTLQVIAFFAAIFSIGGLINYKLGLDGTVMILTSVCSFVYSFGYLLELSATSWVMATTALHFEYLGFAYIGTLFAMFATEYCQVHLPRKFWMPCFVIDTIFLIVAVLSRNHHFFYSILVWSLGGYHPHLEYISGIGFTLYTILTVFYLSLALVCVVKRYRTEKREQEKKKLQLLAVICVLPFVGIAFKHSSIIPGYDPTSFIIAILTFILTFVLTNWRSVNVVNRAYSSLYKDIGEGVIIADVNQNYLDSNAAANFIFPEMRDWEAGTALSNLQIPLCEYGKTDIFEVERRFYTSIAKPIVERHKQTGYLIIISDVTGMHDQMVRMSELKEEADSANQAKSAFLANMSHEMRTPLNAIIGMAELAEREEDTEKTSEYISQIRSSGKMLLDIICDTLDLSKAESGKLDILPVEFDTCKFFNNVINVINMRIGDKPIKFMIDIAPDIPKTLNGDDIRIRQILINFLGNAEKYTRGGSITLKIDYENLFPGKILLKASVTDTGNGIKEEDIDKLFKPFSQVDMKSNRKIVGTGLGLAISAQLINSMGGTYGVESTFGKGSTFSFEIPVSVVVPEPFAKGIERKVIETDKYATFFLYGIKDEAENKAKKPEELPKFPEAKVLVVDDNKVNVKVLCAFLKQFSIVADQSFSGFDALEKVEEKEYDLIFMDHMMPEMDGSETTVKIRQSDKEWNKKVPIVACSANVMKGAEELFLESGMNDYISKPVQLDALAKKVSKYLA